MKKFLIVFVSVMLLSLTGCINKSTPLPKSDVNNNMANGGVKIGDKVYVLNKEAHTKNMVFKYSPDFEIGGYNYNYSIYIGGIDDPTVAVRFLVFEGKTVDEAISNLSSASEYTETRKMNDIEWNFIKLYRDTEENHVYFVNYNNDTYVVMFSFKEDIEDFEKETMNNIYFSDSIN